MKGNLSDHPQAMNIEKLQIAKIALLFRKTKK